MTESLRDIGEFGFIRRIAAGLPPAENVLERIGDDCAVVRVGDNLLLLTCDAAVEEIHFSFSTATPQDIGWRTATAAISDIGAMGGKPLFLTVALAMPAETPVAVAEALFGGIREAAAAHGLHVAGGDTTKSLTHVFMDITVIGLAGKRYLPRHSARPGDLLAVTGSPGRSAGGLVALQLKRAAPPLVRAHLRPQARIAEGQWLSEQPAVHAMIDVSDGLLQDAGHIAEASGLGVDIDPALLPLAEDLAQFQETLGVEPLDLVLAGGEDYELAVALAADGHKEVCRQFAATFSLPLTVVGRFTDTFKGSRVAGEPYDHTGYDHFRI
ncbi:MAG: thiamine-phosphate kinase [Candidatus Hydrogenedentes bacterium]|nr:thiamine-phosphate kinase [Candidatus Hydrogenedentota bacterium]